MLFWTVFWFSMWKKNVRKPGWPWNGAPRNQYFLFWNIVTQIHSSNSAKHYIIKNKKKLTRHPPVLWRQATFCLKHLLFYSTSCLRRKSELNCEETECIGRVVVAICFRQCCFHTAPNLPALAPAACGVFPHPIVLTPHSQACIWALSSRQKSRTPHCTSFTPNQNRLLSFHLSQSQDHAMFSLRAAQFRWFAATTALHNLSTVTVKGRSFSVTSVVLAAEVMISELAVLVKVALAALQLERPKVIPYSLMATPRWRHTKEGTKKKLLSL